MEVIQFEVYYSTCGSIFFRVINSTKIRDVLSAIKNKISNNFTTWDNYYVIGIKHHDELDPNKTVGYYGIKTGDVIRLSKITES